MLDDTISKLTHFTLKRNSYLSLGMELITATWLLAGSGYGQKKLAMACKNLVGMPFKLEFDI